AAHFAIVEAVEVDALSVDVRESIARVDAALHIACGIERGGRGIDDLRGKSDLAAAVVLDSNIEGMSGLYGISADRLQAIARVPPGSVAGVRVARVRPHAIAKHIPKRAAGHAELRRSLFEQNAARGVVLPRPIA